MRKVPQQTCRFHFHADAVEMSFRPVCPHERLILRRFFGLVGHAGCDRLVDLLTMRYRVPT